MGIIANGYPLAVKDTLFCINLPLFWVLICGYREKPTGHLKNISLLGN